MPEQLEKEVDEDNIDKKDYKGFKNLKKALSFYKNYKKELILIAFSELIGGVAYLLVPIYAAQFLDAIVVSQFDIAFRSILIIAAASIFAQIVYTLLVFLMNKVSINVKRDMRSYLTNKAMELKTSDLDKSSSGFFISRLSTDAEKLSSVFTNTLTEFCWALTKIGFVVYIYFMSVYMGLFMTLMLILYFIIDAVKRRLYNKNDTVANKKNEKVTSAFNEVIRGVREIKMLGLKSSMLSRVNARQANSIKAELKLHNTENIMYRAITIFKILLDFAFLSLGIWLAIIGELAAGALVVLYLYKDSVLWMVDIIGITLSSLTKAEVSAKRMYQVIDGDKGYGYETFGTQDIDVKHGKIEFRNVCFEYGENKLFSDLSFTVEPNTTVAIVGKSGEGKTTIFNMLTRAYPHIGGQILVDSVPIEEFSESSLRNALSGVAQRPYIFDDSFYGNLRLVKPDATEEEMQRACKQAHIHDFIVSEEKGYETRVGENGIVLSGGQAQRLALARVLLKGSKIMLLDEATSALDNESQGKVQKALEDMQGNHTMLIIAHRLSTIVNCDKIIVISGGKIVGEGKHADLMKVLPSYRELYAKEDM